MIGRCNPDVSSRCSTSSGRRNRGGGGGCSSGAAVASNTEVTGSIRKSSSNRNVSVNGAVGTATCGNSAGNCNSESKGSLFEIQRCSSSSSAFGNKRKPKNVGYGFAFSSKTISLLRCSRIWRTRKRCCSTSLHMTVSRKKHDSNKSSQWSTTLISSNPRCKGTWVLGRSRRSGKVSSRSRCTCTLYYQKMYERGGSSTSAARERTKPAAQDYQCGSQHAASPGSVFSSTASDAPRYWNHQHACLLFSTRLRCCIADAASAAVVATAACLSRVVRLRWKLSVRMKQANFKMLHHLFSLLSLWLLMAHCLANSFSVSNNLGSLPVLSAATAAASPSSSAVVDSSALSPVASSAIASSFSSLPSSDSPSTSGDAEAAAKASPAAASETDDDLLQPALLQSPTGFLSAGSGPIQAVDLSTFGDDETLRKRESVEQYFPSAEENTLQSLPLSSTVRQQPSSSTSNRRDSSNNGDNNGRYDRYDSSSADESNESNDNDLDISSQSGTGGSLWRRVDGISDGRDSGNWVNNKGSEDNNGKESSSNVAATLIHERPASAHGMNISSEKIEDTKRMRGSVISALPFSDSVADFTAQQEDTSLSLLESETCSSYYPSGWQSQRKKKQQLYVWRNGDEGPAVREAVAAVPADIMMLNTLAAAAAAAAATAAWQRCSVSCGGGWQEFDPDVAVATAVAAVKEALEAKHPGRHSSASAIVEEHISIAVLAALTHEVGEIELGETAEIEQRSDGGGGGDYATIAEDAVSTDTGKLRKMHMPIKRLRRCNEFSCDMSDWRKLASYATQAAGNTKPPGLAFAPPIAASMLDGDCGVYLQLQMEEKCRENVLLWEVNSDNWEEKVITGVPRPKPVTEEHGSSETAAGETAADGTAADRTAAGGTAADRTAAGATAADRTAADRTAAGGTAAGGLAAANSSGETAGTAVNTAKANEASANTDISPKADSKPPATDAAAAAVKSERAKSSPKKKTKKKKKKTKGTKTKKSESKLTLKPKEKEPVQVEREKPGDTPYLVPDETREETHAAAFADISTFPDKADEVNEEEEEDRGSVATSRDSSSSSSAEEEDGYEEDDSYEQSTGSTALREATEAGDEDDSKEESAEASDDTEEQLKKGEEESAKAGQEESDEAALLEALAHQEESAEAAISEDTEEQQKKREESFKSAMENVMSSLSLASCMKLCEYRRRCVAVMYYQSSKRSTAHEWRPLLLPQEEQLPVDSLQVKSSNGDDSSQVKSSSDDDKTLQQIRTSSNVDTLPEDVSKPADTRGSGTGGDSSSSSNSGSSSSGKTEISRTLDGDSRRLAGSSSFVSTRPNSSIRGIESSRSNIREAGGDYAVCQLLKAISPATCFKEFDGQASSFSSVDSRGASTQTKEGKSFMVIRGAWLPLCAPRIHDQLKKQRRKVTLLRSAPDLVKASARITMRSLASTSVAHRRAVQAERHLYAAQGRYESLTELRMLLTPWLQLPGSRKPQSDPGKTSGSKEEADNTNDSSSPSSAGSSSSTTAGVGPASGGGGRGGEANERGLSQWEVAAGTLPPMQESFASPDMYAAHRWRSTVMYALTPTCLAFQWTALRGAGCGKPLLLHSEVAPRNEKEAAAKAATARVAAADAAAGRRTAEGAPAGARAHQQEAGTENVSTQHEPSTSTPLFEQKKEASESSTVQAKDAETVPATPPAAHAAARAEALQGAAAAPASGGPEAQGAQGQAHQGAVAAGAQVQAPQGAAAAGAQAQAPQGAAAAEVQALAPQAAATARAQAQARQGAAAAPTPRGPAAQARGARAAGAASPGRTVAAAHKKIGQPRTPRKGRARQSLRSPGGPPRDFTGAVFSLRRRDDPFSLVDVEQKQQPLNAPEEEGEEGEEGEEDPGVISTVQQGQRTPNKHNSFIPDASGESSSTRNTDTQTEDYPTDSSHSGSSDSSSSDSSSSDSSSSDSSSSDSSSNDSSSSDSSSSDSSTAGSRTEETGDTTVTDSVDKDDDTDTHSSSDQRISIRSDNSRADISRSADNSGRLDSRRPDSRRPDSRRPESRRPDSRRPESRRPDSSRPDSRRPDSGRLDSSTMTDSSSSSTDSSSSSTDSSSRSTDSRSSSTDLRRMPAGKRTIVTDVGRMVDGSSSTDGSRMADSIGMTDRNGMTESSGMTDSVDSKWSAEVETVKAPETRRMPGRFTEDLLGWRYCYALLMERVVKQLRRSFIETQPEKREAWKENAPQVPNSFQNLRATNNTSFIETHIVDRHPPSLTRKRVHRGSSVKRRLTRLPSVINSADKAGSNGGSTHHVLGQYPGATIAVAKEAAEKAGGKKLATQEAAAQNAAATARAPPPPSENEYEEVRVTDSNVSQSPENVYGQIRLPGRNAPQSQENLYEEVRQNAPAGLRNVVEELRRTLALRRIRNGYTEVQGRGRKASRSLPYEWMVEDNSLHGSANQLQEMGVNATGPEKAAEKQRLVELKKRYLEGDDSLFLFAEFDITSMKCNVYALDINHASLRPSYPSTTAPSPSSSPPPASGSPLVSSGVKGASSAPLSPSELTSSLLDLPTSSSEAPSEGTPAAAFVSPAASVSSGASFSRAASSASPFLSSSSPPSLTDHPLPELLPDACVAYSADTLLLLPPALDPAAREAFLSLVLEQPDTSSREEAMAEGIRREREALLRLPPHTCPSTCVMSAWSPWSACTLRVPTNSSSSSSATSETGENDDADESYIELHAERQVRVRATLFPPYMGDSCAPKGEARVCEGSSTAPSLNKNETAVPKLEGEEKAETASNESNQVAAGTPTSTELERASSSSSVSPSLSAMPPPALTEMQQVLAEAAKRKSKKKDPSAPVRVSINCISASYGPWSPCNCTTPPAVTEASYAQVSSSSTRTLVAPGEEAVTFLNKRPSSLSGHPLGSGYRGRRSTIKRIIKNGKVIEKRKVFVRLPPGASHSNERTGRRHRTKKLIQSQVPMVGFPCPPSVLYETEVCSRCLEIPSPSQDAGLQSSAAPSASDIDDSEASPDAEAAARQTVAVVDSAGDRLTKADEETRRAPEAPQGPVAQIQMSLSQDIAPLSRSAEVLAHGREAEDFPAEEFAAAEDARGLLMASSWKMKDRGNWTGRRRTKAGVSPLVAAGDRFSGDDNDSNKETSSHSYSIGGDIARLVSGSPASMAGALNEAASPEARVLPENESSNSNHSSSGSVFMDSTSALYTEALQQQTTSYSGAAVSPHSHLGILRSIAPHGLHSSVSGAAAQTPLAYPLSGGAASLLSMETSPAGNAEDREVQELLLGPAASLRRKARTKRDEQRMDSGAKQATNKDNMKPEQQGKGTDGVDAEGTESRNSTEGTKDRVLNFYHVLALCGGILTALAFVLILLRVNKRLRRLLKLGDSGKGKTAKKQAPKHAVTAAGRGTAHAATSYPIYTALANPDGQVVLAADGKPLLVRPVYAVNPLEAPAGMPRRQLTTSLGELIYQTQGGEIVGAWGQTLHPSVLPAYLRAMAEAKAQAKAAQHQGPPGRASERYFADATAHALGSSQGDADHITSAEVPKIFGTSATNSEASDRGSSSSRRFPLSPVAPAADDNTAASAARETARAFFSSTSLDTASTELPQPQVKQQGSRRKVSLSTDKAVGRQEQLQPQQPGSRRRKSLLSETQTAQDEQQDPTRRRRKSLSSEIEPYAKQEQQDTRRRRKSLSPETARARQEEQVEQQDTRRRRKSLSPETARARQEKQEEQQDTRRRRKSGPTKTESAQQEREDSRRRRKKSVLS